ncbi:MAG: hydrogenase formation protein HypD [Pseudomonadota bacterium]
MKHLDEYRDSALARNLVAGIKKISQRPVKLMEVCGTHTVSIFRSGIRSLLPETITLLSGPGCPVCVTATEEIDKFIELCRRKDVIVTTFGDLIRVPGSSSSLQKERARGAHVRIVYSTSDALEIARENPQSEVVFLGIGFETTAPTIAAAAKEAKENGVRNFSIISAHKLVPPALLALLSSGDVNVDGFICPGHVSVIIGADAYKPVSDGFHLPCVVAGFEPVDILQAVFMLVSQIENKEAKVEIQYKRAVGFPGNQKALSLLSEVFEPCDAPWRGIGVIKDSGLKFNKRFETVDAEKRFDLKVAPARNHPACSCGEILRGVRTPLDCTLYRKACTPSNPVGPCMVSSEGTCAAYYKYYDHQSQIEN